ncbi:MAG: glycoside hydrolase [Bacteroidetes bacterium]|nr:glycoside hydrolase [Bacteroidota bacterium]
MRKKLLLCYLMLAITLLLIACTFIYFSYSSTTESLLRADKNLTILNGPWKFKTGDSIQYAEADYDDSQWDTMNLAAPIGVHDDDVGLSGFVPGWAAKGYPNYSGYAWYRLKVSVDSLPGKSLAFAGPPAVDDVYQLFIDGALTGSMGDFSGAVPKVYSIQPRMFLLPEGFKKGNHIVIAFRVWMSSASRGVDAGGIRIAPTLGEKTHIEKKYRFQWEQTVKGYIVEVVWPLLFLLLAITIYVLNRGRWFVTALILLGLMRLNQAVYFWFHIENSSQAVIVGTVILRPLVLGSWLMAWREWFSLDKPKWLPKIIAVLTLLFMAAQLFGISWVSHAAHVYFQTMADYIRLLFLGVLLLIIFWGVRKEGGKGLLVLVAALLMLIALFPKEISDLHIIPGIWFPYGVGVSRGQFFYVAFVIVMYGVLIRKNRIHCSSVG